MKSMETGRQDGGSDKNHAPFSVGETGNISRKFLTIILKIFDKNFERLHLMAGFLYVGAGIGMIFIALMRKIKKYEAKELKLTKSELPYTIAMIVLDIAAPICLLFGLNSTTAANASLLNNF